MRGGRLERLALLLTLGATLAWLTLEEKSRLGAAVFALPWGTLIGLRLPLRPMRPLTNVVVRSTLAGALVGPLAGLLMLLKVGLHAHVVPDYDLADVLAMLAWTPWAAALGMLFGIGIALIRRGLGLSSKNTGTR